jgi:hypothetical protein
MLYHLIIRCERSQSEVSNPYLIRRLILYLRYQHVIEFHVPMYYFLSMKKVKSQEHLLHDHSRRLLRDRCAVLDHIEQGALGLEL